MSGTNGKRPHLAIDSILAEGVGTADIDGQRRTVLAMSAALQHELASLADIGEKGITEEHIDRYTRIAAACLKPTVEPRRLRDLPLEYLTTIIQLANSSSLAVETAIAEETEGNGQRPATAEAPAIPSPS